MSESSNPHARRRSDRAQQLYNARMMPDAEDTAAFEPTPVQDRAAARREAYQQRFAEPTAPAAPPANVRGYDESQFTPNEPTGAEPPVQVFDTPQPAKKAPAADKAPEANPERAALAANLSAYYRRAANVSAQEDTDPFTRLEWPADSSDATQPDDDPSANVNIYRMQEASWAQEERQTMLAGDDAGGYQVKTEERRLPGKRRRRKRLLRRILIGLAAALVIVAALVMLLGQQEPESIQEQGGFTPVVTTTPQPIRGYDAAPAMAVSDKTGQAIDQISGPVDMATCAVTEGNVLTRSLRADGLYDYYLFSSNGRLLAYFDKLPEGGMFPMKDGGFYVGLRPYLINSEGSALLPLENLEQTIGTTVTLRPMLNSWACVITADGKSNLINREGHLISRLWFSRSFPMTGMESAAYVDTGVEGSPTRYALYLLDSKGAGNAVKWRDAADDREVVACALGMIYLQNGDLYQISSLLADPNAAPLCNTPNVRFYTDCGTVVVQDASSGKYALYVNGQQHYDFIYDSILPVESDVRWQADILPGGAGQAMVLAVTGAGYPQPLSHYFVLSRGSAEEYIALSAITNCPILLD